jgi:prevent-host-death family protein
MDVGVRELKAHLSEYLDRAAAGEVITVTDRGKPVAVLAPLPSRVVSLDQAIAEGWVTAPTNRGGLGKAPTPHRSALRVLDVLAEDRGE